MTVASTESGLLGAQTAMGVLHAVHDTAKEIVGKQQELADQAKLEADMALEHVPPGSDLERKIRNAINGLMASVGKGDFSASLSALKAAVAEAQRAVPEVEQRKSTQHYYDALANIELTEEAKEHVRIRSLGPTDENLPAYVKSYVNDFKGVLSEEERADSAKFMEDMLRNTDEGKAHRKAMALVPKEVLEETATHQLKGKQLLETMLKDKAYGEYRVQIRQMIERGYYNLPESEVVIMQIHSRVDVQVVWTGMGTLREQQGKDMQAFGNALTRDLSAKEKEILRSIGGDPIDGPKVLDLYFEAGAAERKRVREKYADSGFDGLSEDEQKIYTASIYVRRSLPAASMAAARRWAENIVKERGLSEHQEQGTYLLKIGEIVESKSLNLDEKVEQAYAMLKDSPDLKRLPENEAKALMKASITEIEARGGLEAFSKLSEAEIKKSEPSFMKNYTNFSAAMSAGVDAMLSGDAKGTEQAAKAASEKAADLAIAQGATKEQAQKIQESTEMVLGTVGSVVVNVTQIFTTTPKFSEMIDQELATLNLGELQEAQRKAITDKDGKVDLAKLKEALGNSLTAVDANKDGIVNGVEALQALKASETGRHA